MLCLAETSGLAGRLRHTLAEVFGGADFELTQKKKAPSLSMATAQARSGGGFRDWEALWITPTRYRDDQLSERSGETVAGPP
jgi:hypothetical protein